MIGNAACDISSTRAHIRRRSIDIGRAQQLRELQPSMQRALYDAKHMRRDSTHARASRVQLVYGGRPACHIVWPKHRFPRAGRPRVDAMSRVPSVQSRDPLRAIYIYISSRCSFLATRQWLASRLVTERAAARKGALASSSCQQDRSVSRSILCACLWTRWCA